ncbi:MAG TPA: DinB family protein [Blastocatellia bacterium]|nr:DinB family protein [Blastocatellia bacterium]
MQNYVIELREVVEAAYSELIAIPDAASARRANDDRWSPREVIGHLIDSASINHQRFVRAQFQDDLIFPTYEQEDWVRVQRYGDAPWDELLSLWRSYNLHIAHVMASAPEDVRRRKRTAHNFHRIGWQAVAEGEPATLDYLMRDYVGHLKHHLRQIL